MKITEPKSSDKMDKTKHIKGYSVASSFNSITYCISRGCIVKTDNNNGGRKSVIKLQNGWEKAEANRIWDDIESSFEACLALKELYEAVLERYEEGHGQN